MTIKKKTKAYLVYVVSKVSFENDFNPPTLLNMIKLKEQRGKKI